MGRPLVAPAHTLADGPNARVSATQLASAGIKRHRRLSCARGRSRTHYRGHRHQRRPHSCRRAAWVNLSGAFSNNTWTRRDMAVCTTGNNTAGEPSTAQWVGPTGCGMPITDNWTSTAATRRIPTPTTPSPRRTRPVPARLHERILSADDRHAGRWLLLGSRHQWRFMVRRLQALRAIRLNRHTRRWCGEFYVDPTQGFSIGCPNGFVVVPQDLTKSAQFTPMPIASTFFMNPTMAAGDLAGSSRRT